MDNQKAHIYLEFIVQYWAQIIVLLTAIGYIIKLFLDWNIKKSEIEYSSIFVKRSNSLEDFIFHTLNYMRFFKDLPMYDVGRQKITPKELDQMESKYRDLYLKSYSNLNIYIDNEIIGQIREINAIIVSNNKYLTQLIFSEFSINEGENINSYQGCIYTNNEKLNKKIEHLIMSHKYRNIKTL